MANNFDFVEAQMGDPNKESIYNVLTENIIKAIGETLTVDFPSNANFTPTYSPPGTPGVMVAMRLLVTSAFGSLTATRNLVLPLRKKVWLVVNNTTGGQSIQVIGATGTGVTIRNGADAMVVCDGINFLRFGQPQSVDVQIFSASGTWTKPLGAKTVSVQMIGGGGGGGSGRKGAAVSTRFGGGGGGGGGLSKEDFLASALAASETVTVGAGGIGGLGQATNNTNGNPGTAGGDSIFGASNYLTAKGGTLGAGGTTATGTGGTGGLGSSHGRSTQGGPGGSGSGTGGFTATAATTGDNSPRGGGGGGGIDAANTEFGGGTGGAFTTTRALTGGTPGLVGGPTAGGNGNSLPTGDASPGSGGGGGAAQSSGTAGIGGNGGNYGAGGGGSGASANSGTGSGNGGNGAPGIVVVISYF